MENNVTFQDDLLEMFYRNLDSKIFSQQKDMRQLKLKHMPLPNEKVITLPKIDSETTSASQERSITQSISILKSSRGKPYTQTGGLASPCSTITSPRDTNKTRKSVANSMNKLPKMEDSLMQNSDGDDHQSVSKQIELIGC